MQASDKAGAEFMLFFNYSVLSVPRLPVCVSFFNEILLLCFCLGDKVYAVLGAEFSHLLSLIHQVLLPSDALIKKSLCHFVWT